MENIQYTTIEGERWDNISYKAYGDPGLAKVIIEANPNIAITDVLAGGILLIIPLLEDDSTAIDPSLLPPWLRE